MPAPPDQLSTAESGGFSLDQLSQAFATMLGQDDAVEFRHIVAGGNQPDARLNSDLLSAVTAGSPQEPGLAGSTKSGADTAPNARSLVEAILFVGSPDNLPITCDRIAGLARGMSALEIEAAIRDLNEHYNTSACPYVIVAEESGYRLTLRSEFEPLRDRVQGRIRAARLSPAAIEVLAIVAYNQPVTADQVAARRGTPSGHILSQLVRRQLLRLERSEEKPRKTSYYTTKRFLDLFHLRTLQDLPRSDDLSRQ